MSDERQNGLEEAGGRAELVAAVKSVREEWRAALLPAKLLGEGTKLGRQAGVVWRDLELFEESVRDAGGEEGLMTLICAHMAGRGHIEEFCEKYRIDEGLLGAFISETPERMERFVNALKWKAEVDVSRTVPLADGATMEDYKVKALQIKARMDRAGVYNRGRFGTPDKGGIQGTAVSMPASIQITFVEARDGRPVIEGSTG